MSGPKIGGRSVELLSIAPAPRFVYVDPLPCRIGRMNAGEDRNTETILIQPLRRLFFDVFTVRGSRILLMTTVATGEQVIFERDRDYTFRIRASAVGRAHGDEANFCFHHCADGTVSFKKSVLGKEGWTS